MALVLGAAGLMFLLGPTAAGATSMAAAHANGARHDGDDGWRPAANGARGAPTVHPTSVPIARPYCPPPTTRPPLYRPPVTRPPVTRPPVTAPTTTPTGVHTSGGPPPTTRRPVTKPVGSTTTNSTTTTTAPVAIADSTGGALRLDTYDTFQTFVKGLAANAQREAEVRAAAARSRVTRSGGSAIANAGLVPGAVDGGAAAASPAPDLFPHGPLFNDTPAPLLPLGASGLRSARSFVLLFALSAVALVFLAFRARMARRHALFGAAAVDDRGDYVDFV